MVQWVRTGWNKPLFGSVTGINLAPSCWHVSPVMVVPHERCEVEFFGQCSPVAQIVMRERGREMTEITRPSMMKDEEQEKREPKNDS
ncbi:unnamed protein product [Camellia sinensis]